MFFQNGPLRTQAAINVGGACLLIRGDGPFRHLSEKCQFKR